MSLFKIFHYTIAITYLFFISHYFFLSFFNKTQVFFSFPPFIWDLFIDQAWIKHLHLRRSFSLRFFKIRCSFTFYFLCFLRYYQYFSEMKAKTFPTPPFFFQNSRTLTQSKFSTYSSMNGLYNWMNNRWFYEKSLWKFFLSWVLFHPPPPPRFRYLVWTFYFEVCLRIFFSVI